MNLNCKSINCRNPVVANGDFCTPCSNRDLDGFESAEAMAERYPDRFKSVGDQEQIDTYSVHQMFQMNDPSGCLQNASTLLLMQGASTNKHRDIRQARDLLTRWIQLNQETPT